MKKHLQYLRYLIRHKYYVFLACCEFGLFWRGLKHDWSKFLPSEWFPYAESFYGRGKELRIAGVHKNILDPDYAEFERIQAAFDKAWLLHQHRNPHHWQHYILREDDGATKVLKMDVLDAIEMYCDWVGAGRAITGQNNMLPWYQKTYDKRKLHPETLRLVEQFVFGDIHPSDISAAALEDEA